MPQAFMYDSKAFGAVCIQVRNTEGANTYYPDPQRAGIFRIYRVKDVGGKLIFQAIPFYEQYGAATKITLEALTQRTYLRHKLSQAKEQYSDTWFRLYRTGIIPPSSHPDLQREESNVAEIQLESDLIPKMLDVLGAFSAARNNSSLPMLNWSREITL